MRGERGGWGWGRGGGEEDEVEGHVKVSQREEGGQVKESITWHHYDRDTGDMHRQTRNGRAVTGESCSSYEQG